MKQSKLTKAEIKWLNDVQAALKKCPSKRIGFYTIGDNSIHAYDYSRYNEISDHLDNSRDIDFGPSVSSVGADFGEYLWFPQPVESTAG